MSEPRVARTDPDYPGVGWLLLTVVPSLLAIFFAYAAIGEHEPPHYGYRAVSLALVVLTALLFGLGMRGVVRRWQRGLGVRNYLGVLLISGFGLAFALASVAILREGRLL